MVEGEEGILRNLQFLINLKAIDKIDMKEIYDT